MKISILPFLSTALCIVLVSFSRPMLAADNLEESEFTNGPDFMPAPETVVRTNVPHGQLYEFTMDSHESRLYPGIAKTQPGIVPYQRKVCVYVPQQYMAGTPAALIVAQDGMGYTGLLPVVLDNMIADHRLPAMVAVMINSGGGDAQGSERGLEYDTISGKYAEFIETEVLPRIEKDYGVTFTKDPEGRATMGCSSGAAAAFTMAWFHPEWYRRVISYSGTFVNQQWPFDPANPGGAWDYHQTLIPGSATKPIRIWMQVGDRDLLNPNIMRDGMHDWVMANHAMAAALKRKHYQYQYTFALDAGHCDQRVREQTLPEALEWVWRGYRAEGR